MLTATTSTVLATPLHPHFNTSQLTTLLHLPANFSFPVLSNALPICIEDLAWSTGGISKFSTAGYEGACRGALGSLNHIEPIDSIERKFLASNVPGGAYPYVETPRRYVYSDGDYSCRLVIAMLSDFPKGILPGQPAGTPFARTAVSTWETIAFEAFVVLTSCLEKDPQSEARFGYATAGYRNIGVFFWATGAVVDGDVPRGVRPVVELDAA